MINDEILEVRRAIGDTLTPSTDEFIGDGQQSVFKLTHPKAIVTSVMADLEEVTDYTFENGIITLGSELSQESILSVSYLFGAYSDEEIDGLLTRYGKADAIIECLKELLAGSARLTDYQHGQTTVKGSQKFAQIKSLLDMYLPGGILNNDSNGVTIGNRTHALYQRGERDPLANDLSRTDRFETADTFNSNLVA